MMAEFTPTPAQRAAIETTGTSVLVSAGAGSGKTAVLAQRCARILAERQPPCPVERLLVVTFTDAAAAQMRQRIAQALRLRLEAAPTDRWLQRQLALLETASISTIHAFCRRVLNRYFAQADLDPQAPIMDANDASLLRQETARQVFDRFADRGGAAGEAFLDFLAAYGGGGEQGLIRRVLAVDAFLTSIPDPEQWIADASKRHASSPGPRASGPASHLAVGLARRAATGTLSDSWTDMLHKALRTELTEQLQTVHGELAGLRNGPPAVSQSVSCLEDYREALQAWLDRLEGANAAPAVLDQVCRDGIGAYGFPKAPRKTSKIKELPEAEQQAFNVAAETVRNVGKALFEKRLMDVFGRFTTADWAEGIARTRGHVETFLALATGFRKAYQNAKRDLGVVDFADLERMTLHLLHDEGAGVTARLRDQYDHVLVDEFQDINAVQAEILRLVSRECEPGRPGNLFAVGDVKQSIYRFRLAEPRLFLDRRAAFLDIVPTGGTAPKPVNPTGWKPVPHGRRRHGDSSTDPEARGVAIDLLENFRSRPPVIDAINAIFERLMAADLGGIAYDEHARLKPGPTSADHTKVVCRPAAQPARDEPARRAGGSLDAAAENAASQGPPLELHLLEALGSRSGNDEPDEQHAEAFDWEQIEREAHVIARRIKDLAHEGTPYSDIVVLLRSMQPRAGMLLRTISRLGVPVFADSSGGFFESLEVLDLLSLLELLDNEQQDIPLAAVLRSPLFGPALTDDELVEIRVTAGARSADVPFCAAVRDYARRGPDATLRPRLATLLDRLGRWRQRARQRPLADVLWEIYEESGYLAYVAGLRDGRQRRANLLRLHEYARQFGTFQRQGLHRFLQFINGLQEAGEDLDAGSVVSPSEDVVRVMTIHRSKGLEFPVVILGELGKLFNLIDARGTILFDRRLGLAMEAVDVDRRITYPTLPHRLVSKAALTESLAEEMRVLYVALTRAEQRLILVGTGSPSELHRNRQRYAGHKDVIPVLDRRTARSMLDWVLAAICCQPPETVSFTDDQGIDVDAPSCPLFKVRTYHREQMAQWVLEPPVQTGVARRLERCARMEPLDDVRAEDADPLTVETVKRRLTTPYSARALTRIPAVAAASALKRRWNAQQDDEDPTAPWSGAPGTRPDPAVSQRRFREPAFLQRAGSADPTRLGTWTHEFLQRLDLGQPCDAANLRNQREAMVDSGTLLPTEAAGIDLDAIGWFFKSPLGAKLRSNQTRVLREWPFVMGADPARYDPNAVARADDDLMLVRGIIDCLFDRGDGWEILDYKTDAVSDRALVARADDYRGQLQIYADAVEAVWQQAVPHRWLVFLSARQIVEV